MDPALFFATFANRAATFSRSAGFLMSTSIESTDGPTPTCQRTAIKEVIVPLHSLAESKVM
jgi:hypothetical protein